MHPKEFKKVKNNTGRFTHLNLKNSELFVGIDFSNHTKINKIIDTHDSYILYPSADAVNLTHTNPKANKDNRPLAIFLIDSTWSCSKKIFNESENLQKLKHMSFVTTRESQYKIKEQPKKHYLSTIESTLVVLKLLNKWKVENIEQANLDTFLDPFYKMILYQKALLESSTKNSPRFKLFIKH